MRKKILYLIVGFFFFFITFFSFYFSKVNFVESFTQLESISDTISTSHGESGANHRIRFRVTSDVFGGGKIVFQPISKPGSAFNIPPEMDYTDVGLFVNDDEKPLSSEPSEDVSGVNFISGEEGQITITLADNLFLNEGDIVVIQIGKNNNQIVNPSVNAAYWIRIRIFSSTDTLLSTGETAIFILDPVNVGIQTLVPEPIVGTVPASVIGANAVVLRGQLLNMGPAEEVDVFFEYREMDSEDWKRTGKFGRKSIVNFSEFVAGLEAGTEY